MKKSLVCMVATCSMMAHTGAAEIIYDNSDNYLAAYNETLLESGDQVQFEGSGRLINFFAFEYFASLSSPPSGTEQARVRFYLNDGAVGDNPSATPGTLLYDSGAFAISTNFQTVEISDLSVFVPSSTLTWTVQFSGLSANEKAGVLFYDPPQVGSSGNFLWQRESNVWTAVAFDALTNNLSGRFTALPEVAIKSLQLTTNAAVLTVSATAGKFYALEYKTNVDQVGWIPLNVAAVHATTSEVILKDTTIGAAKARVYRVVERDTALAANLAETRSTVPKRRTA